MHVDRIPNRSSPPAYLLRETYREGQKVKKRTLANISHWPLAKIEALRRVLRGDFSSGEEQLTLLRSLPHGHVAAALGTLRKLTYFEGRTCPLAQFGHDRDGKGKLQIVFGLLCTAEGCPVAVEVFEGNVGDPSTLASQVSKLKGRFALERVVLVGDRGMITEARLEETIKPAGLDWITALRAPAIRSLAEAGTIQLSLFDQRDLAEITSPDYPGERLIVCRNPLLAEERTRKRQALLDATEKKLLPIQAR